MSRWRDVVVTPETPLKDAIAKIDASRLQVALVLAVNDRLLGIVTDGDVRRAILAGKGLEVRVGDVMTTKPTSVSMLTPREEMLALMRRRGFHHLPLLDHADRVVGLVTLDELIGVTARPNWVVLMAGGLGTRLLPLTNKRPKPLLTVGGKPILETIIEGFAEQGFKKIYLSVNYKADMILDHFGDGERWGVQVEYLRENERLGTAGALSLLPERPSAPIIVMNADLLTRLSFDNLLQFHASQSALATMVVREYDLQVPYGVVHIDATHIKALEEKPVQRFFVNAGIYALSPAALDRVPSKTFFDMPTLFEELIEAGEITAAYPLRESWMDIGRLEEFERAQTEWAKASE